MRLLYEDDFQVRLLPLGIVGIIPQNLFDVFENFVSAQ